MERQHPVEAHPDIAWLDADYDRRAARGCGGALRMRGLKILVIVMGVLIVAGFTVVIAVIADRLARRSAGTHGFTAATLDLPRGARIGAMTAGGDRLVLELFLPDGGHRLLVLDLATGANLGAIDLRQPP